MTEISTVNPHYSATRDGGETVEITGSGLEAVTSVAFGPFEASIVGKSDSRLTVTAPGYRPGWGGEHGEVLVWAGVDHVRTGVVWTWAGMTLAELGGPIDEIDLAVAHGTVPDSPVGNPNDPVDRLIHESTQAAEPASAAPAHAVVESFTPAQVEREGGWITVHGHGFTGATAVSIGALPCTDFEVRSDTVVVALVPANPGGVPHSDYPPTPIVWQGDIASLLPAQPQLLFWHLSGNASMTFMAEDDPTPVFKIESIVPQGSATLEGGEEVVITGTCLAEGFSHVYLGQCFVIHDAVVSDTEVRFRAPAWSAHQGTHSHGDEDGRVGVAREHSSMGTATFWTWGGQTPAQLTAHHPG